MLDSWTSFYELVNTGSGPRYQFIYTGITELPEGLPMPPNDHRISFNGCHKLVDISALADWDTSKLTSIEGMFNHCHELADISPIAKWDTSNVTNMSYLFNCCYKLNDISHLYHWNIGKVTKMRFIFNGCHSLPKEARFDINYPIEFSRFMDQFITPILYPVTYEEAIEEEEIIDECSDNLVDYVFLTETNKADIRGPPSVDQSWLNQTTIVPLKLQSDDDYSDDFDLTMTICHNH